MISSFSHFAEISQWFDPSKAAAPKMGYNVTVCEDHPAGFRCTWYQLTVACSRPRDAV